MDLKKLATKAIKKEAEKAVVKKVAKAWSVKTFPCSRR